MSANSVALELVPPSEDSIVQIERALVDGLFFDPKQVNAIRALLTPQDFFDPFAKTIFRAFIDHDDIDGWPDLQRVLEQSGDLELVGGLAGLAKLGNTATPAGLLPGMAEDVGLAALDRRMRTLARRIADDPTDSESLDSLIELREQAAGRRARRSTHDIDLADVSFSGDRLAALLHEEPPEPVYPGMPPEGHLSLLIAPSFSGKTSLALWVAMSRIKGHPAWVGAPEREPGRVLFYSIDEAPGQVAHRIASLATKHPAGRFADEYVDRFTIIGPHREVDPDKLNRLKFTDEGLHTLRRFIREADDEGDPFSDVIIDSYSDVLPDGSEDIDNREATRIGGALEQIAVTYGCAIQLIHHAGKPKVGVDPPDPRDLGRGASALAAKARAIFTCEEEVGMPTLRKIRTRTNLTRRPKDLLLEVVDRRNAAGQGDVDFFRPHDPAMAYPIDEFLGVDDDWISVTQLARRMGGDDLDPDKKPPGNLLRRAREMRGIWEGAGLAEIRIGARKAMELRRV